MKTVTNGSMTVTTTPPPSPTNHPIHENGVSEIRNSTSNGLEDKRPLKLVAFGNALVDISVRIDSDDILKRYQFGPNEQGECKQELLDDVLRDVRHRYENIDVHPGGSAINTCRILSDLGEMDTMFHGCVGNDENGRLIKKMLMQNKVNTCLQVTNGYPTGSCLCLIYEDNRCCFANIGASIDFQKKSLLQSNLGEQSVMLNGSLRSHRIFYIEGFFITKRMPVCEYIYETFCGPESQAHHLFAANLSAEYMIKENKDDINYLAEKSDILFGNRSEFLMLAQVNGMATLSKQIEELNRKKAEKIIVVTNGDKYVDVFIKSAVDDLVKHERLDVEAVKKEDIVDTTGAGDSFVAGFFFAYFRNETISDCVRFGIEIASKKIRAIGAKLQ